MPKLPPSLTRDKLIKGLRRLGFLIDKSKGDGSHYKLYSLDKSRSITIPKNLESIRTRGTLEKFIVADIGKIEELLNEI